MSALGYLEASLAQLEREGRRRWRPKNSPGSAIDDAVILSSNDYLGYATRRLLAVASDATTGERRDPSASTLPPRSGAGASRLISGDHPEHRALENEVATWLGYEDSLVFTSGYAANVGVISALAGPGDLVISDALNHASIIDGCRLSRAHVSVTRHGDTASVANALTSAEAKSARRVFVVTEGYFSMDGDTPDLVALRTLTTAHGAVMIVDDAHALGVLGPEGRGACAAAGVTPDVLVGTFGKALGGQGAFVAGPRTLTDWLWNRARSFVFSTGISPWIAAIDLAGLRLARRDDEGRARLREMSLWFRGGLVRLGLEVPPGHGPIIPVLLGADGVAVAFSCALADEGIAVAAIRPPTVPVGTARLRITLQARLSDDEIERALSAFSRVVSRQKEAR